MLTRVAILAVTLLLASGLQPKSAEAQGAPWPTCNEFCNWFDFGGSGHDIFSCTTEAEGDSSTQGWACQGTVTYCSVNVCNVSDLTLLSSDAGETVALASICRTAGASSTVFALDEREILMYELNEVPLWQFISATTEHSP